MYSNNPNQQTQKERQNAQFQLNEITSKKTQFLIQQLKYDNFENSNKSGKYLANQLQCKKERAIIPAIKN